MNTLSSSIPPATTPLNPLTSHSPEEAELRKELDHQTGWWTLVEQVTSWSPDFLNDLPGNKTTAVAFSALAVLTLAWVAFPVGVQAATTFVVVKTAGSWSMASLVARVALATASSLQGIRLSARCLAQGQLKSASETRQAIANGTYNRHSLSDRGAKIALVALIALIPLTSATVFLPVRTTRVLWNTLSVVAQPVAEVVARVAKTIGVAGILKGLALAATTLGIGVTTYSAYKQVSEIDDSAKRPLPAPLPTANLQQWPSPSRALPESTYLFSNDTRNNRDKVMQLLGATENRNLRFRSPGLFASQEHHAAYKSALNNCNNRTVIAIGGAATTALGATPLLVTTALAGGGPGLIAARIAAGAIVALGTFASALVTDNVKTSNRTLRAAYHANVDAMAPRWAAITDAWNHEISSELGAAEHENLLRELTLYAEHKRGRPDGNAIPHRVHQGIPSSVVTEATRLRRHLQSAQPAV